MDYFPCESFSLVCQMFMDVCRVHSQTFQGGGLDPSLFAAKWFSINPWRLAGKCCKFCI